MRCELCKRKLVVMHDKHMSLEMASMLRLGIRRIDDIFTDDLLLSGKEILKLTFCVRPLHSLIVDFRI